MVQRFTLVMVSWMRRSDGPKYASFSKHCELLADEVVFSIITHGAAIHGRKRVGLARYLLLIFYIIIVILWFSIGNFHRPASRGRFS